MGKLPPGVEFLAWQSPRTLARNRLPEALSELRLARGKDAKFHREGLRADRVP